MSKGKGLSVEEAQEIVNTFVERRELFPNEADEHSLMVVLFNFGDRYTPVECINREWKGIKADIPKSEGIPRCPNGHVMFEGRNRKRLELVDYVI